LQVAKGEREKQKFGKQKAESRNLTRTHMDGQGAEKGEWGRVSKS
jgi:hypothetical protein